jgi:glycosyltransferase involved in cell wall biosynthesis
VARVLYSAFDVVPSPKGASTHVAHFVRGLVAGGHEVTLVTPRAAGLSAEEGFEGARHLRVGTPGGGNFLRRALEFGEAVAAIAERQGPFEVAHFRSVWSGLPLVVNRNVGQRLVFEANSLASVELPFHYPSLAGSKTLQKIRRLELRVLRESDAVVCVSKVSRTFLAGLGAPARRLHVIPNGVDTDAFAPRPVAPADVPTAVYVGTLADWQGIATLVEALPRVLARRPLRLRIVGRGRSRQRKDAAKRVRKLGLQDWVSVEPGVPHAEVPALLAAAHVGLAPLEYNERNVVQGCCPLKVLEYMAAGRPIVASNLPVVRELVRDGKEALLVTPGAPDAVAEALLRLLGDRRLALRMGEAGARRARERFTWTRAQTRLRELYDELLRPGTAPDSGRSPRRG